MARDISDIRPCIPCEVVMERRGDTFAVKITDSDGEELQELNDYTIVDGDVLSIRGLGFLVSFGGDGTIGWTPQPTEPEQKPVAPSVNLKRKMDIK